MNFISSISNRSSIVLQNFGALPEDDALYEEQMSARLSKDWWAALIELCNGIVRNGPIDVELKRQADGGATSALVMVDFINRLPRRFNVRFPLEGRPRNLAVTLPKGYKVLSPSFFSQGKKATGLYDEYNEFYYLCFNAGGEGSKVFDMTIAPPPDHIGKEKVRIDFSSLDVIAMP